MAAGACGRRQRGPNLRCDVLDLDGEEINCFILFIISCFVRGEGNKLEETEGPVFDLASGRLVVRNLVPVPVSGHLQLKTRR